MSDESIVFALEVLDRSTSLVSRATLQNDLHRALEEELPSEAHGAIVDALALFKQAEKIASGRGTKRNKGEELLHLLNLTNAKSRYVEYRDRLLCKIIASEMRLQDMAKFSSVLRDEMANIIATDPAEISKIWRAGRASALARVTHAPPKKMVADEKIALAELSQKLGNSRGN